MENFRISIVECLLQKIHQIRYQHDLEHEDEGIRLPAFAMDECDEDNAQQGEDKTRKQAERMPVFLFAGLGLGPMNFGKNG